MIKIKISLIEKLLMPLILSILMTCVISFVSSIKALGFSGLSLSGWLQAWLWSWLIAFPTLLLVLPLVKQMTQTLLLRLQRAEHASQSSQQPME